MSPCGIGIPLISVQSSSRPSEIILLNNDSINCTPVENPVFNKFSFFRYTRCMIPIIPFSKKTTKCAFVQKGEKKFRHRHNNINIDLSLKARNFFRTVSNIDTLRNAVAVKLSGELHCDYDKAPFFSRGNEYGQTEKLLRVASSYLSIKHYLQHLIKSKKPTKIKITPP